MNKKTKISLAFLIFGGALTIIGTPLFIVAGVGVKSISLPVEGGTKTINSGYFSYKENFELVKGKNGFDETLAKDKGYSFDFYGYANYMIEKINDNDLPQPPVPEFASVPSINDVKSFYENVVLNKPLFITGAVLWPIGVTTILISLPIFISFKNKGE